MTDQATPKIFVCVPAYGQIVTAQTMSTVVGLTRVLMTYDLGGGFGTLSFPDITEIRNIFATIWYDKIKTSHMLFIDADMGFDPQLVVDMVAFNKPLVGVLCPKRKIPTEFAGRARPGPVKIINNFMEVDGVGGAIMLIRRDCVDAILGKYPELIDTKSVTNHAAKDLLESQGITRILRLFDKVVIDGETFSEDLSMCHRWRDSAPAQWKQTTDGRGEVWANIGYEIAHVGQHEFRGRYLDHIRDELKPLDSVPAVPEFPIDAMAGMMQAAE